MVIGIKNLKLWSKVNEMDIQYRLEIKYPKPNNHPYKKKSFVFLCCLDFLTKKKKNKVNVKKLITK